MPRHACRQPDLFSGDVYGMSIDNKNPARPLDRAGFYVEEYPSETYYVNHLRIQAAAPRRLTRIQLPSIFSIGRVVFLSRRATLGAEVLFQA